MQGFVFPAGIISHCVWLYHHFPPSFREVEKMVLESGIVVSHETIRQWCTKFGQTYANALRRRRPRPGPKRRCEMADQFTTWNEVTGTATSA